MIDRRFLPFLAALLFLSTFAPAAQASDPPAKFQLHKGDRIVFLGNTFADQLRLYGYLETLLTSRYPDYDLTFRNLGWSGDTLSRQPRPLNFGSLDEHLTRQSADVIFACFGMGESFAGEAGLPQFAEDWKAFLAHLQSRRYNGQSPPRLVLISPIAHERRENDTADAAAHNRSLEQYTRATTEVADQFDLPCVDLFHPTKELTETNPSQRLTHNGIHLNEYGYWAVSQIIVESLTGGNGAWKIELNAAEGTAGATSASVDQIVSDGSRVQFRVRAETLPVSPAPAGSVVHPRFAEHRPQLVVTRLNPGRYMLLIDGREVATATAAEWAAGVNLEKFPLLKQTAQLRSTVNNKNAHFFYRWRAHNSEYIFGRRTKPFGIVSFPPEMKQLDRMIQEKDRTIHGLSAPPAGTTWELRPVAD